MIFNEKQISENRIQYFRRNYLLIIQLFLQNFNQKSHYDFIIADIINYDEKNTFK